MPELNVLHLAGPEAPPGPHVLHLAGDTGSAAALFRLRVHTRTCTVADRSNWLRSVQRDLEVGSVGVLVAALIADHADAGGGGWASQKYLARCGQLTDRTVRNVFTKLLNRGWVELLTGYPRAAHLAWRGKHVTNRAYVYRICCPATCAFGSTARDSDA